MSVAGDIIIELKLDDKDVSVNVRKAGATLQQFQGTLDRTANSVKRMEDAQTSLSAKFRHLVMTLGNLRFVAMDVNDIFLRLPLAVLKSAGELERMQVLMKGLSKELTEAGKNAEGLRDFKFVTGMAKNAPFEITALSDAFVKLKTAGIDPTNGSMNALVDSVARFGGSGEQLKRASVAIQQMSGKGVVSMEELRQQLGEAVPTAMQDMADGMGVSMQKLAKIVQTGTLTAGPAIEKMLLQMRINNEGAASEMMKTWSGMLARLKSEWELTAKFIADNGFGDAAKNGVAQLTEMLKSDDFRRFAADSGQALGQVTSAVIEVAQTLIKYRSEILTLAQAWLAYKIIFSGIVPLSARMKEVWESSATAMARERDNIIQTARHRQQAAVEEAAAGKYRSQAQADQLARTIAANQAELLSVKTRNAQLLAEDAAMAAKMAAGRGGVNVPGMQGFQSTATAIQYRNALNRENMVGIGREKELTRAIADSTVALGAANMAAGQKAAALFKLTNATGLQHAATVLATGATRAFSVAMSLMGGPIGLAITAIMGLIWYWNKAGDAAEASADRQRRAALGLTNAKDLSGAQNELMDAERQLALTKKAAQSDYLLDGNGAGRKKTQAEREKDTEAIGAASSAVVKAREHAGLIEKSVIEQNAKFIADSQGLATERKSRDMQDSTRTEIAEIEKARRLKLSGMKKDSDEYIAANNESNKLKQDALIKGLNERIQIERNAEAVAQNAATEKNATAEQRAGNLEAADQRRIKREQLELELEGARKTIEAKVEYKPKAEKPKGGAKSDPLVTKVQSFIGDLNEESVKLQASLKGLLSNVGKIDSASVALAEAEAKLAGSDFKQKGKGGRIIMPTSAESQEIKDKMVANAKLDDLVADLKRVSGEINAMEPDYVHAMAVIADPLRTVDSKKSNRWDEILAKLRSQTGDMTEAVAKMEEGKRKAATIDLATGIRELAEENRRLGFEIIIDDEARVRAQIESDNELRMVRENNRVAEAKAAGVNGEQIAAMQIQMDKNAVLRAEKLRLDTRTPMEKMVDEWSNSTKAMQQSTAQWAQQGVDAFVNFVKTGKLEWSSLVQDMLAGILKVQVQKMAASALGGMGGGGGAGDSAGGGGSDWMGSIAKVAASFFSFADGGIMSAMGSVPLKKYAAGGVATSPQLALYGEGSMNEAYVPLPDGRTIPVTMTGGGGPAVPANVVVNVINQSGQQVGAKTGVPKFDGKQMVLDVVLTAVSSPGPFRDGMKGALGG